MRYPAPVCGTVPGTVLTAIYRANLPRMPYGQFRSSIASAKSVLVALAAVEGQLTSATEIAWMTGMSVQVASGIIGSLIAHRFVDVVESGVGNVWKYRVNVDELFKIRRVERVAGMTVADAERRSLKREYNLRSRKRALHVYCRGELKTLVEWQEVSGVPSDLIRQRLRRGADPEWAIFTPRLSKDEQFRLMTQAKKEKRASV